jgi:hypothetical protein
LDGLLRFLSCDPYSPSALNRNSMLKKFQKRVLTLSRAGKKPHKGPNLSMMPLHQK